MFGTKPEQLKDLQVAYQNFLQIARNLTETQFLASLGDWTPRDILAHFAGWNRITLVGCCELREGIVPFYFYDGTNDYRIVNAGFFKRFASQDRDVLLKDISDTMDDLVVVLRIIGEDEREKDTGVPHYRGGFASVARCVDSLIRDYHKHGEEITQGIKG